MPVSVVSFVVSSRPCLPLLVGPRDRLGLGFWLRFACGFIVVLVVVGVVVGVFVVCCGRRLVVGAGTGRIAPCVAPGVTSRCVCWCRGG